MRNNWKKLTGLLTILIFSIQIGYSQCDYSRYGNAPRELTVGSIK
jgi:hypothetical protein